MWRKTMTTVCGLLLSLASSGCIVVIADVDGWEEHSRAKVTNTEERTFETTGVGGLDVETHNGSVTFNGQSGEGAGQVTITKIARGSDQEEAQAAMDAIEVYVEPKGDAVQLGWRWKNHKKRNWSADVNFDIKAPGRMHLDVETHNGEIKVAGVTGDVDIETHNGEINVNAAGKSLEAESHNGEINAVFAGTSIDLSSHNGEVTADLSRCAQVTGSVTSHNGAVQVSVGTGTSASLEARSSNGGIDCEAPLTDMKKSRRSLDGTLGSGGGKLEIETHNGAIAIKGS
jgi:hypothetical protein